MCVKRGHGLEAVVKLNTAMRLAPPTECEEIGWIAATRSAATHLLGLHDECYRDCQLALECLPSKLTLQRFKLWDRAASCGLVMGKDNIASDALEAATEELKHSDIQIKMQEKLLNTMKDNFGKYKRRNEKEENPSLQYPGENKMVSKKVVVSHNEGVGRHVKAVEDIGVGEVIVQESPISSVLHLSKLETNCSSCLVPVCAGHGCDSCTQVIFCSPVCKEKAEKTYHKVECGNIDLFPPVGPLCPAFRLITSHSLQFFLDNRNLFEDHDPCAGWGSGDDEDQEKNRMRAAFNMQVCDKDPDYVLNMTALAYVGLHSLHKMNFFGKKQLVLDMGEDELYIGSLLYHFLRGVEENSHEIVQFEEPGTEYCGTLDSLYDGEEPVISVIGAAFNSVSSLFNNSCDVNTVKYHQGNNTTIIAKRNIKAGEEVTDFYGQHFFHSPKQARQQMLGFPCQCTPCKDNWPLLNNLRKFSPAQLSQRSRKPWVMAKDRLDSAVNNMKVKEAVEISKKMADIVGVSPPHDALVMPEMYFHYSLVFLHGNKSLSFQLFADKIKQRGEISTEEKKSQSQKEDEIKKILICKIIV